MKTEMTKTQFIGSWVGTIVGICTIISFIYGIGKEETRSSDNDNSITTITNGSHDINNTIDNSTHSSTDNNITNTGNSTHVIDNSTTNTDNSTHSSTDNSITNTGNSTHVTDNSTHQTIIYHSPKSSPKSTIREDEILVDHSPIDSNPGYLSNKGKQIAEKPVSAQKSPSVFTVEKGEPQFIESIEATLSVNFSNQEELSFARLIVSPKSGKATTQFIKVGALVEMEEFYINVLEVDYDRGNGKFGISQK